MRLKDKSLHFIVNFLLGVAWASIFLASITTFYTFYKDTFFFALVSAFIAALPGMIAILLLEHFISNKEKLYELQKHTKLLQALLKDKEQ